MSIKRIGYSKRFIKDLKKSPVEVRLSFRKRLELFLVDKYNPVLNNHQLTGKYVGYRSINITGDWRAIYREFQEGTVVFFDTLGTYSKLYK